MLKPFSLNHVSIHHPFFSARMDTAWNIALPYMWQALNDQIPDIPPSGCIHNFRLVTGETQGEYIGFPWQDSDLWKWVEGAAYALAAYSGNKSEEIQHKAEELKKRVNSVISLAARAQQPDGYLDTFYIFKGLKRFTNLRDHHELYIAGHLFEAACAWHQATGLDNLLKIACRVADCLDRHFGPGDNQCHGYPGHQEVEIGLSRLYLATGEQRYLNLAKYFLDERGKQPYYFEQEAIARGEKIQPPSHRPLELPYSYHQAHLPVREQKEAIGHAVRQCYMLAAMADVGALSGDETLVEAADRVFHNIMEKQMYITGGVGSTHIGEAFSFNYDLPADRCYTETCASIALMMTAIRLSRIHPHGKYGDVVERALYNGVLPGVSLDGEKYFYMNPLEVWQDRVLNRNDLRIDGERQGWFGCACCPPNVLRTITGLGNYLGFADDRQCYVDQYISADVTLPMSGGPLSFSLQSGFPWQGDVKITIQDAPKDFIRLNMRLPGWARGYTLTVNGEAEQPEENSGYLTLSGRFDQGDVIRLSFPMPIETVHATLFSPDYAGKCTVMRGPLVYCLEEIDNGSQLWALSLNNTALEAKWDDMLAGVMKIVGCGLRQLSTGALYSPNAPDAVPAALTFIPYYAWGNCGKGDMTVWIRK